MKEHPISIDKASELLAGPLGDCYRKVLIECCVPIYWFKPDSKKFRIKHSATVTIVRTPKKLLGITAAHVLEAYLADAKEGSVRLQLGNEVVDNFRDRIINISRDLDIATFSMDDQLLLRLGKTALSKWPPQPPSQDKGIMIAGFPEIERHESETLEVNFGLFTAIGVARSITGKQITWLMERERRVTTLPPKSNLSGISGGPLISFFESENFISHHCLSGIVIEQPNHQDNEDMSSIERLIAIRADCIADTGNIIPN